MAIVADIADLSAAEFLLMLSLNQKSGKLTGGCDETRVQVVFRNGSIVYAASTTVGERIGSLLVRRGLVREATLQQAVRTQQEEPGVKHLGTILVEMGAISAGELAEVVRSQFQRVLAELLSWTGGVLAFERMEIPDLGAVHVDPREILVDMGFETEQLVLGTISELEDGRMRAGVEGPEEAEEDAGDHDLLRTMMRELQDMSLSCTAEVTLSLLTRAMEVVDRAVLLLVGPERLTVAGGFGIASVGDDDGQCHTVEVARADDSIFAPVLERGLTYRGPIAYTDVNRRFLEALGEEQPSQAVVVPLQVAERVVAVLYGDNAHSRRPVEGVARIEEAARATAQALERRRAGRGE